jgi:hypothetical protein
MKKQGNYTILININRARYRHWNKEVKSRESEKLGLSHDMNNEQAVSFCPFLKIVMRGYIVTFIKILTIYRS